VTAFDRYVAVDWSAANSPVTGKDSIWIGEAVHTVSGIELRPSRNPRTRSAAMAEIEAILSDALSRRLPHWRREGADRRSGMAGAMVAARRAHRGQR
jgi:hypothetical protein